jgi:hypothetical protein
MKPELLSVSSVIIGAGVFGCIATLVTQFLWRRGRSKNDSAASSAPAPSSNTVA